MYNTGDEDPEMSQPGCINKCKIMMTEPTRIRIEREYIIYNALKQNQEVEEEDPKKEEVASMIRRQKILDRKNANKILYDADDNEVI